MKENRKQDIDWIRQEYEQKRMTEIQVKGLKNKIEEAKRMKQKKRTGYKIGGAVAAAAAVLILLPNTSANVAYAMSNLPVIGGLVEAVTFRDYQYEDERHKADISIDEIAVTAEDTRISEELEKSVDEINAEIQKITDEMVAEFEKNLQDEWGYQDIVVNTEVLDTTEDYFTLKLMCYQGAGSGAEWDYFYTIDLNTGERLQLKELFAEGADYITPISENIKNQMREQMAQDEMVCYWVDYEEVPDWNFKAITDETSFYLNADENIVICFDEGEVAPMYIGTVEFVIPKEVTENIRK